MAARHSPIYDYSGIGPCIIPGALTRLDPWGKTVAENRETAMTLRSAARLLLVFALGLPVVHAVLIWVGGLLTSMGDDPGAEILRQIGTGCLVTWTVAIVALVIVLAIVVVNDRTPEE
jgi:hypothetical protein